jgi:hypothetical protein
VAQTAESLLCKSKALSSNSSPTKKKKKEKRKKLHNGEDEISLYFVYFIYFFLLFLPLWFGLAHALVGHLYAFV